MAPANNPATSKGSLGSASNYQRMVDTYGPARAGGSTAVIDGPPSALPPVPAATRTFTADGAFNKAGLLGVLALAVGALAYVANLSLGLVWPLMIVALGAGLWASFRPQRAKVLAPVFAVTEGAVLGVLSRFYANQGQHVVTLAIVGTLAVVGGVWFFYRTGLVRVGSRFIRTTMVASLGFLAVIVVSLLTGWGTSGLGGFVIFGVLYLFLAVMNLFVDYDFAYRAQAAQLSADAEWYSAFSLLLSSAMVYLALLRIFGGRS
jgi:uncharacterized YccA/Bax inhibitor family protein